MTAALAEAWLLGFLLLATLWIGALAVLATGLVLDDPWLPRLRPDLSAAARAWPALVLAALPLVALAPDLYPWAAGRGGAGMTDMALRLLPPLILWSSLGWWLARADATARRGGIVLLPLALTASLTLDVLALSRDEGWTGSLLGAALVADGIGAALALATLSALRDGPLEDEARAVLERALLSLAVASLWFSFVQFIVVWAADLPGEAAWYLRRSEGGWFWLAAGVVLPSAVGAIALGAVPGWSRGRMATVCGLIVIHWAARLIWTARPDAVLTQGSGGHLAADLAMAVAVGLLLAVLLRRSRGAPLGADGV